MEQNILEKNNLLLSDEKAEEKLKTNEYILIRDYGKDKKFIVHTPYIPLFITPTCV